MIGATEVKRGEILDIDGSPREVTEVVVQTPSARGASLLVKVKTRNLRTGQTLARTCRGNENLDRAECEKHAVQFLYRQDEEFVFMDLSNYGQFTLSAGTLVDAVGYLADGLELRSLLYNGEAPAPRPEGSASGGCRHAQPAFQLFPPCVGVGSIAACGRRSSSTSFRRGSSRRKRAPGVPRECWCWTAARVA